MVKRSAGILLWRREDGALRVLLAHPGGPFWRSRDDGAWCLPKGEIHEGEAPEAAARREFEEELGAPPPASLQPLGTIRQKGGKYVEAFAAEGDFEPERLVSNRFELEWPPKSGEIHSFPEVDGAAWFALDEARVKILPSQLPLLDLLVEALGG
jgi:predicted NUDIX family NTP pyrophosphohydrolase